jgi:regulator of sirC expression with transglutaminase-like and TPR domain
MPSSRQGRHAFIAAVRRLDEEIDLVGAALAIASEDREGVDVERSLRLLEALVERTRRHLASDAPLARRASAVVEYLHGTEGFAGDARTYDDPQNSYLDLVLERHVGLPITLSLVLWHVGTALGLPFEPAALPGHFMVRCADQADTLFLDLFNGQVYSSAGCRAFLQAQLGYDIHDPERFPPPARAEIVARLLRNLKRSYLQREDMWRALAATERILIVDPASTNDLRDRGLLRAKLGDFHRALHDLEQYALLEPMASDLPTIRTYAQTLAAAMKGRN